MNNKDFRVITISGFFGFLLFGTIALVVFFSFFMLPTWGVKNLWNFYISPTFNLPQIWYLHASLLWTAIALSIYAFMRRYISFGIKTFSASSDKEIQEYIDKISEEEDLSEEEKRELDELFRK